MERSHACLLATVLSAIIGLSGCEWAPSVPAIPTEPGVESADDTFACLSGSGRLVEIDGNSGYQAYKNRAFADNTRFDAGTSVWHTQQVPEYKAPYPINIGGGKGGCWAGGIVVGANPYEAGWGQLYARLPGKKRKNSAGIVWTKAPDFVLDGIRIHNAWDAIRVGTKSANFTIKNVWVTYNRDDCVENDNMLSGLIDDSLFDGCYVAFSARSGPDSNVDGRNNTWMIRNSLIRLQPMPGAHNEGPNPRQPGHKIWFKWRSGQGPKLKLYHNIFMAEQVSNVANSVAGIPPMTRSGEPGIEIAGCKDNVLVWLGDGSYPYHLPDCFTVTRDRSVWDRARQAWIDRHPKVPRLPDEGMPAADGRS